MTRFWIRWDVGALTLVILLGSAITSADDGATEAPDWFLEHNDFLTAKGGVFHTDNSAYQSEAEPWDAYGLAWQKGPSGLTLRGRLFALREGREARHIWEFFVYWHAGEGRAYMIQVGGDGTVGVGHLEPPDESGVQRSEQTFHRPDGSTFRVAHEARTGDDLQETASFDWVDGSWRPRREYVWRRVPAAESMAEKSLPSAGARRATGAMTVDPRCGSEAQRAFDFLLGAWRVRSADGGDSGTVRVTPLVGGCAIHEEWSSPSGRQGTSVSTYSAEDERWHQTYVDNTGAVLRLAGEAVPGGMVLFDESSHGGSVDRFGWHLREDGTVRQTWERSTEQGIWSSVFEATWVPVETIAPPGSALSDALGALAEWVGTWEMTAIQQDEVGEWKEYTPTLARVEPVLAGTFLRETAELDVSSGRLRYLMLIGFDPFQKRYRVSWNDSLVGLVDIYEGSLEEGLLVLDNLESETFWGTRSGEESYAFRLEYEVSPRAGERRARVYVSDDLGETWSLYQTTVYRRLGP